MGRPDPVAGFAVVFVVGAAIILAIPSDGVEEEGLVRGAGVVERVSGHDVVGEGFEEVGD